MYREIKNVDGQTKRNEKERGRMTDGVSVRITIRVGEQFEKLWKNVCERLLNKSGSSSPCW